MSSQQTSTTRFPHPAEGKSATRWMPRALLAGVISLEALSPLNANPWILVAVVLAVAFTIPQAAQAPFVAFLFPLASFLEFNVITAAILAIIVLRFSRSISSPISMLLPILGILALELLSSFSGGWQLGDFTKFSVYLLLASLLATDLNSYDVAKATIHSYLLGFAVFGVVFILTAAVSGNVDALINPTDRLTDLALQSANVSAINPNTIGIAALMALALVGVAFYDDRSPLPLLIIPLALWIGLLTGSRTFTLGVLALGSILVAVGIRWLARDGKILLGLVAGTVLLAYYVIQKFPQLVEMAIRRITEDEDITNGRVRINTGYWESFISNPKWMVLGGGLQKHSDLMGSGMSVHNAPLEMLLSWGIVGGILVTYLLAQLVLRRVPGVISADGALSDRSAYTLVGLVPAVVLFVALLGSQGFSIWRTMLYIPVLRAVIILGVYTNERKKSRRTRGEESAHTAPPAEPTENTPSDQESPAHA